MRGPNNTPAERVNNVRGTGATVTMVWTAKNTRGKVGPTAWAHSRICSIDGCGAIEATTPSATNSATRPNTRRPRELFTTFANSTGADVHLAVNKTTSRANVR